jgi:ABC-type nitrate/sulfonate/bicarbonate transport system permease component
MNPTQPAVATEPGVPPADTPPAPLAPRRKRARTRDRSGFARALPWLSFVLLLVIWEVTARAGVIDEIFFSSPTGIWHAGVTAVQTVDFWNDTWISLKEFLIGYVAAVAVAVPFGLGAGYSRRFQYFVDPWLNALNSTPRIALLPLVVLWFGLGLMSKVAIVFIGVFVSVAINTLGGVRTVDRTLADVASTFGASGMRRLTSVVLPGILPFALVGMRLGVGRAVAGVMVAEFFTSQAGLGNFIFRAGQTLQTGKLLFGAVFITILALLGFHGLTALERRFSKWRPRVGSA